MPDRAASSIARLQRSATPRKPAPRQARSIAKREAILDHAERLLESLPPEAITTRRLADAADIPVGSIYRYFGNAQDVLLCLFARMNAGTLTHLRGGLADPDQDWSEHLARTFDHLLNMHNSHPSYGALMIFLEPLLDNNAEIAQTLSQLIRTRAPQLSADRADQITQTVMALIDGIERQLYRGDNVDRASALNEGRIAVEAYLRGRLEA